MAYFDDPNKKENWEAAMVGLREERERRQAGEAPEQMSSIRHYSHNAERVPVSFEQLLEEDRAERMAGKSREHAVSQEAEMTAAGPETGKGRER